LQAHVKSDEDPLESFQRNNARRAIVKADVEKSIAGKPLGALKVEAFKWCLEYVLRFQISRDNERHFVDRSTYSLKKAFAEVGRRLRKRGALTAENDHYFLTQYELFDLLAGAPATALTRAKIASRRKNFEDYDAKAYVPPKFLQHNRPLNTEPALAAGGGGRRILQGLPTSRGTVTATARVVKKLSEIGRVNPGEILVANSTDPGWTPVFAVISGVVVETGGLMSHSSCLAREYGFPAALVEGAVQAIPDGATITLNGDTGEVQIDDVPEAEGEPERELVSS
jgi:pyruvate,water dikinase